MSNAIKRVLAFVMVMCLLITLQVGVPFNVKAEQIIGTSSTIENNNLSTKDYFE